MLDAAVETERSEAERAFVELTLLVVAWSVVGWLAWRLVESAGTAQRDLMVYRRAGTAFRTGMDPYAVKAGDLPFVYPPLVLPVFAWLSRLPATLAYWLWLAGKACSLVALLAVARRYFEPFRHHYASLAFLTFAFNGTIYADVLAGNIALFEQAFFWGAVAAFLGRRYVWFTVLAIFAAQVKLAPAALLILPVVLLPRAKWGWTAAGAASLAAIFATEWLLWPTHMQSFLRAAAGLDEDGYVNPCSYSVAHEIARVLSAVDPIWNHGGAWIYGAFALVVLLLSSRIVHAHRAWLQANPAWCVCFIVCAYALVVPRFKDYSYVTLLIPAWLAVVRLQGRYRLAWLPLLVAFPMPKSFLLTDALTARSLEYVPWGATVALLVVLGVHIRASAQRARLMTEA